jgi:Flp pilus assembly protein TadG
MIIFPAVMLLILTIIQAGLWWHARNVALAAAQQGVEAARGREATLSQGTAETRSFLDRAGGSLSGVSVTGTTGATVRIEVTGTVDTIVPGLKLPVDQHAEAAKERLTEAP